MIQQNIMENREQFCLGAGKSLENMHSLALRNNLVVSSVKGLGKSFFGPYSNAELTKEEAKLILEQLWIKGSSKVMNVVYWKYYARRFNKYS
jgi:hypothetical protein